MTLRRPLGIFTLLAMVHFIIVGTAAACVAPRGDATAASAHESCPPAPTHSKSGTADRPADVPCCSALASCTTAPIAAPTALPSRPALLLTVASALAERAPSAEAPAPELPPPRA